MSSTDTVDLYGTLAEDATLTIRRLLPGPIDRVWSYLTESDLRRQWLAAGSMDLAADAPFTFTWRNSELTDPPGTPPDGSTGEHSMECRIVEVDPPRKLTFTWNGTGDVTFELEPMGDEILLTVTHRRIAEKTAQLAIGPGWHAHLDLLAKRLQGQQPEPFWDSWIRLRGDYAQRFSA